MPEACRGVAIDPTRLLIWVRSPVRCRTWFGWARSSISAAAGCGDAERRSLCHGIVCQGRRAGFSDPTLGRIAVHRKGVAQIVLRWPIQRDGMVRCRGAPRSIASETTPRSSTLSFHRKRSARSRDREAELSAVCTENLIRVDDLMESLKLAE